MKSWQDKQMPYYGSMYGALTHHNFWDGNYHYWTGMAVKGAEDQDPDNPNCCHDLAVFESGEVEIDHRALKSLRYNLRKNGHTHRAVSERIGRKLSYMRQRLYGQRPFKRAELNLLCRLCRVDPDNLIRRGWGNEHSG